MWSSRIVDLGLMTSLMTSSSIIIIDTKRATSQTSLPVSFTEVLVSFNRCTVRTTTIFAQTHTSERTIRLPACYYYYLLTHYSNSSAHSISAVLRSVFIFRNLSFYPIINVKLQIYMDNSSCNGIIQFQLNRYLEYNSMPFICHASLCSVLLLMKIHWNKWQQISQQSTYPQSSYLFSKVFGVLWYHALIVLSNGMVCCLLAWHITQPVLQTMLSVGTWNKIGNILYTEQYTLVLYKWHL